LVVFIVARGCPTQRFPQNGIFEFDQAKALAKVGHHVHYIALDLRSLRRWRKLGFHNEYKEGVYIHRIDFPCGRIPIRDFLSLKLLKEVGKRLVSEYGKPDLVHAHFTDEGYYSAKVFKQMDIPIVLTEHSSAINEELITDKRLLRIAQFAYKEADVVIAVGNKLASRMMKTFGIKPLIVPNIVSLFGFNRIEVHNNTFKFLCVANLVKLKRIDLLLNCFSDISKKYECVDLTVIGDGEEKRHLLHKVHKLGVEDKVHFLGRLEREDVFKHYRQADCFVLPSSSETFGVAFIEAISMGVPVIATKCGGPEDFVNSDNGILIDVDSRIELYDAMEKFITHKVVFNMEKQSRLIRDKYSDVGIANQLTTIYQNLCK